MSPEMWLRMWAAGGQSPLSWEGLQFNGAAAAGSGRRSGQGPGGVARQTLGAVQGEGLGQRSWKEPGMLLGAWAGK